MSTEATLRPADREDLAALAEVHLAARAGAGPAMPGLVHTPEQVRAHHASWDLDERVVWVAEVAGRVVAHAALRGDWLDDLYVHPDHQGEGIGSALLDLAKVERPDGFCLWAFVSNTGARRFYARHGLVELESTDGAANEERAPDVRLAWPGRDPVAFLRRLIDEVDDELGDLLERRAALTRAVQPHKSVRDRDTDRERAVAARMAERTPTLGPERVARIAHVVITESLAAVEAAATGPRLEGRGARQDGGMTTPLGPDVAAFLAQANPAVMASNRPDGQPVSVATWYLLDDDRILLNMDARRARLRYLREDPRVSLTVLAEDTWYTHVSVQGSIVEWRDDQDLADIDRLSRHYGGKPYPDRERPRVSGWMTLENVHTWGTRFR